MHNLVDKKKQLNDEKDFKLRPQKLCDYVGQKEAKEMLDVYINTSIKRVEPLDHTLLFGPPGLGKTTLAYIIANELGSSVKLTTGPALSKPGDLASILASLDAYDVLFIDEIHRIPKLLEEMLYTAMEDFSIDIIISKDNNTSSIIRMELPPFTLVGATTRFGDLSSPLRDRFGIILSLHYYTIEELSEIIQRTSLILNYPINKKASIELAKRSRGTPRIANRLFRRIRDFAQYKDEIEISYDTTIFSLEKLNINKYGLNSTDQEYLKCIIKKFHGGPVGIDSLSATLGEESITLEEVIEPFLLQEGFILRTHRGRIATDKTYKLFNIDKKRYKDES